MGRRDVGMVNSENLRIPVWVSADTYLRRPEHDIWTRACVDRVTITADIVSGVVDSNFLHRIQSVVDESYRVPLFVREEGGIVAIEAFVEEPTKQMNSELVDEALGFGQIRLDVWNGCVSTFAAGSRVLLLENNASWTG